MTLELLAGLALFATVASITPGPNNLMLMASGANYGFIRTVPHIIGVELGFTLMLVLIGAGIGGLFEIYPGSLYALRVACTVYIVTLALKLVKATSVDALASGSSRPMTAVEAALFQWVNPKAWAMALTAVSLYAPDPSVTTVLLIACVFVLVGVPSVSAWTALGQQLRKRLSDVTRLRRFNAVMALLLIASVLPILRT